jgi:branched-chain amino acid transport system permease protein
MASREDLAGALAFVALAIAAPALPSWLLSLATIAFAHALVVLGLVILWRAGLVPFGQALFYAIGAYAVALLGRYTPLRDVFLLVFVGVAAAGLVAFLVGFLLARYREIFFRDAEHGDVHDPLRRAGEDRDARLDRRIPCRSSHLLRPSAAGRGA